MMALHACKYSHAMREICVIAHPHLLFTYLCGDYYKGTVGMHSVCNVSFPIGCVARRHTCEQYDARVWYNKVPTLQQSSVMFLRVKRRLFLGLEKMAVHGYSLQDLRSETYLTCNDSDFSRISGDMYCPWAVGGSALAMFSATRL